MRYVKVEKQHAQRAKESLMGLKALDNRHKIITDDSGVAFPIAAAAHIDLAGFPYEIIELDAAERRHEQNFRERMARLLSDAEFDVLVKSFDTVGDIAILEIPAELHAKEKLIAQTILDTHKNIKVVLKKAGIHGGEFRTQEMAHLAGEHRKETVHKENGARICLDVEQVYFSTRSGTERMRIAQSVQPGEDVLVLFSGCAPFVCVIAKNSKARRIVGIEKNPTGHAYGLKNLALNRIKNAELFVGDVKELAPRITERFDRIVMPLPKSAQDFLHEALLLAKPKATLHFYDFKEEGQFEESERLVIDACRQEGWRCTILRTVMCGNYAPRVHRICVDALIERIS